MAMISIENLFFSYPDGTQVLNGVNLSIEKGDSVAIIGRNGSGKTTLVKHLNGLLQPTKGKVSINGVTTEGKEPAELSRTIGLVFQNPDDQIFSTKVYNEVAFGPRNLGLSASEVDLRVNNALEVTNLGKYRDVHPYDLTITERKLLCLATILAMDPQVLVLDEPTTAQDQVGVIRLGEVIHKILQTGKTVITITHDMEFVAEFFNRSIVMRLGEIILDGTTEDVYTQVDLLRSTYVKPPSMAILGQEIGAPRSAITVHSMMDWIIQQTKLTDGIER